MFSNLLTVFALAALTFAQSTTISLYIPGADTQPLVGSVVGSDATATTYVLECAQATEDSPCGFPDPFTLTEGPATAAYTLSGDVSADSSTVLDFSGYFHCSLDSSSAVCTESFGGSEANDPGMSTATYTGTDFTYMPVVITAGPLNTGGAAPSSTATGMTASITSQASAASSEGSKTSSGVVQTQGSSSVTTGTSTGGVPMITRAGWVMGGAALAAVLI